MLDFESDETHLLLNPRLPREESERLERLFDAVRTLPGQVWLATSGTTGSLKLAGLSKRALLASAAAVNRRLGASSADVWCCVLPTFHVGGLGIQARAALSRSRVVTASWSAAGFVELCNAERVTLASLVPAQVKDLIEARLIAPPTLRAIIVGGGALPPSLYEQARAAEWPLMPSYGMTETASQVATASRDSPELLLLDHVEARVESDGRLAFRGPSLFTGYATESGFVDPKVDGWFVTEDVGEIEGNALRVLGRAGEFVKIGGESVDLTRLDRILAECTSSEAAIVALPDERLGWVIALAVLDDSGEAVARVFNERVLPFERIRRIECVDAIPRTALGKIIRARLVEKMQ